MTLTASIPRVDAAIIGLREHFRELAARRRDQPYEDYMSTLIDALAESLMHPPAASRPALGTQTGRIRLKRSAAAAAVG